MGQSVFPVSGQEGDSVAARVKERPPPIGITPSVSALRCQLPHGGSLIDVGAGVGLEENSNKDTLTSPYPHPHHKRLPL